MRIALVGLPRAEALGLIGLVTGLLIFVAGYIAGTQAQPGAAPCAAPSAQISPQEQVPTAQIAGPETAQPALGTSAIPDGAVDATSMRKVKPMIFRSPTQQ